MGSEPWHVLLLVVLPPVGIYTGLLVWSARRDRWLRR
jgi:hypothetical protein